MKFLKYTIFLTAENSFCLIRSIPYLTLSTVYSYSGDIKELTVGYIDEKGEEKVDELLIKQDP